MIVQNIIHQLENEAQQMGILIIQLEVLLVQVHLILFIIIIMMMMKRVLKLMILILTMINCDQLQGNFQKELKKNETIMIINHKLQQQAIKQWI